MSKSLPMLPSLAGGSGVAAHVLDDADLVHVVDAVTLDADRDRKVTLGELKDAIVSPDVTTLAAADTALGARLTVLESYLTASGTVSPISGASTSVCSIVLAVGTWAVEADAWAGVAAAISGGISMSEGTSPAHNGYFPPASASNCSTHVGPIVYVVTGSAMTVTLTTTITFASGTPAVNGSLFARRLV